MPGRVDSVEGNFLTLRLRSLVEEPTVTSFWVSGSEMLRGHSGKERGPVRMGSGSLAGGGLGGRKQVEGECRIKRRTLESVLLCAFHSALKPKIILSQP